MPLQTLKNLYLGVEPLSKISEKVKGDLIFLYQIYADYFDRLWGFTYNSRYNAYTLFLYLVLEDFLAPTDEEIKEAMDVVWTV